ncbi:TPA: hypothetical protein N0F65_006704 [Lagenidium giganteum]|uniref:SMP-30/Gluconolactonase/LRE-like region domain-containing protein n=1 Tax=Lagenidium giganteum TaxID=4803 RepID=A0AAV2Z6K9_9STRA|nr:TPA: hypothetical protein N0F65_006704 [Lagenidium giganteum]
MQPELFPSQWPNLIVLLLPLKWLWIWFSRRFNVFAKTWNTSEPMATLLLDGVTFGEGPRFRRKTSSLYFSDMYAKKVVRYDLVTRSATVVHHHDGYVSGIGWLPDDRMLVVSMNNRRVLAIDEDADTSAWYADVSAVTRFRANDFVVAATGNAYIGNFGFQLDAMRDFRTTTLVRIAPDQSLHVAATDLFFPNGTVITPDGKTLIVAETFRCQLTAFDIQPDGSLTNRRVWAYLGCPPDGISLDAEGCIWVAVPQIELYKTSSALVRVREGGEIVNLYGFGRNNIDRRVYSCQLGTDADGQHHLYFFEAFTPEEHALTCGDPAQARRNALLKAIPVAVGPALMPGNPNYSGGYC